ncbi:MAG: hypothetical protein N4A59_03985 [Marinifilum sp.]|jgi:hypothetical protein|nr:hypothetical protein [Marinifilum sp.]
MRNIVLVLSMFVLMSCSSNAQQNCNLSSISKENKLLGKEIFFCESNSLLQVLGVKFKTEDELEFTLIVFNKSKNKRSELSGVARMNEGDMEFDEDENGESYPVNEYFYKKDCWLSIRIDADNQNKLRIISADCEKYESKETPFTSDQILIKKD